jgi:hypothetical protein
MDHSEGNEAKKRALSQQEQSQQEQQSIQQQQQQQQSGTNTGDITQSLALPLPLQQPLQPGVLPPQAQQWAAAPGPGQGYAVVQPPHSQAQQQQQYVSQQVPFAQQQQSGMAVAGATASFPATAPLAAMPLAPDPAAAYAQSERTLYAMHQQRYPGYTQPQQYPQQQQPGYYGTQQQLGAPPQQQLLAGAVQPGIPYQQVPQPPPPQPYLQPKVGRLPADRPLMKLSVSLIDTYKHINTVYYEERDARRAAKQKEKKGSGSNNNGWDDDNYDYIFTAGELFFGRYKIRERIGKGSFGQVVRAEDTETNRDVAIKIIKSKKPFLLQAKTEIELLTHLWEKDPEDEHNIGTSGRTVTIVIEGVASRKI